MAHDSSIYSIDDELRMLRESARRFLVRAWPAERAVLAAKNPEEILRLWGEIAAQGWLALGVDAASNGMRMVSILLQELGRAACPAPLLDAFLGNIILGNVVEPSADIRRLADEVRGGRALLSCVLGPCDGDANAGAFDVADGTNARLSGRGAFVEGTAVATHFLVITSRPRELAIVAANARGVVVTATPGIGVPPLAEIDFNEADAITAICAIDDWKTVRAVARLGLAARALGAADRGFELVTDYAKVRVQFGKKIGQYQAIQHKLANCLINLETSRLALLRATAAFDRADADWLYTAGVATAVANPALRQVCLETHHAFGGVSFWEEHEMPRHFRRIHADLVRCGGVYGAREDIAGYLLGGNLAPVGQGRLPDLDLGDKANTFRQEVREWLAANWKAAYTEAELALPVNERLAKKEFSKTLARKGWLGVSWPEQFGGQGRSTFEQLVFEEEMAYAEAPIGWHLASVNMMGPTIREFGSAEQRERMLPEILKGNVCFCLGYSEPDHGSDLAGITTRASRDGDEWVIRGQKLYTSTASYANYCWLAARTDPDAVPSHAGISVFIVPMNTPGITLQPLHGLNDHRSNVVFWDDVRVPASAIVGEVNGGWKVITAALAFERVALASVAARGRSYFDKLLAHVMCTERNGRPLREDTLVRDRIASLAAEIEAARLLAVQTAQLIEEGKVPAHEAAMSKVYSGELMERLAETAFDLLGSGASLKGGARSALIEGAFEFCIRDAFLYVIGGGTNEIQRTLIALRGLGLPR